MDRPRGIIDHWQRNVHHNQRGVQWFGGSVAFLVLAMLLSAFAPSSAVAQTVSCNDFDAWPWAQTVFESDPGMYQQALDPDLDGIACPHLTINGFEPVLWAEGIPSAAVPAQVAGITDGDTFKVTVEGIEDTVRLYDIDTPETLNLAGGPHCGGDSATDFLTKVLSYAPDGTVYIEYDQTQRDRFDRRLAYVWYQIGDDVYLVNEVMVRNGFAESETYEPHVKYRDQLNAAEQFSVDKVLGVRLECGRFGQPIGSTPSKEQVAQARRSQPDQGQFPVVGEPAPPVDPPPAFVPTEPPAQQSPTGNCDPSYPGCAFRQSACKGTSIAGTSRIAGSPLCRPIRTTLTEI